MDQFGQAAGALIHRWALAFPVWSACGWSLWVPERPRGCTVTARVQAWRPSSGAHVPVCLLHQGPAGVSVGPGLWFVSAH